MQLPVLKCLLSRLAGPQRTTIAPKVIARPQITAAPPRTAQTSQARFDFPLQTCTYHAPCVHCDHASWCRRGLGSAVCAASDAGGAAGGTGGAGGWRGWRFGGGSGPYGSGSDGGSSWLATFAALYARCLFVFSGAPGPAPALPLAAPVQVCRPACLRPIVHTRGPNA